MIYAEFYFGSNADIFATLRIYCIWKKFCECKFFYDCWLSFALHYFFGEFSGEGSIGWLENCFFYSKWGK